MRISDWSSDVCSSDLIRGAREGLALADSGAGALRGLEEGRPPRQIALSWFKTQSGFAVSDQMAYGNELAGRSEERRVGKECVIRVDIGGRRIIKKKKK